jgi:stage II sporulation SpoAA-like protein
LSYQLTIEERPTYVYARVDGELTPANALRFLEDAHAACVKYGRTSVLLDMQLHGPDLPTTSVYDVISQRARDGSKLSKIAYVPYQGGDPSMATFAETVAINRGVNVRLFDSVAAAERWLSEP